MNKLLERPTRAPKVVAPALPQVNLLPPEVRDARGLRVLKRQLLIGLALVVALCIAGFGYAKMQQASASDALTDAQNHTASLQAEMQKYHEVPETLQQLAQVKAGLEVAMSTDVDWQTAIDQIAAVLPDTVSIDNYVVTGANPMTAPAAPSNPLQGESVGQIAFTLRAADVVDTAPWIDAMNSLPGFQDAWFSTAGLASDDSGAYYAVQGTVQFTQDRYTERFSATADDADEKG